MSVVLFGPMALDAAQYLALFMHFLVLSLLAVGGAISTLPEMQRIVVGQHGWLTETQFSASVALAQAAPGPNVLFVAVIGYNVGGLVGVAATMAGTLLPSTALALTAARLGQRHAHSRALKSFKSGLAPLTVGLLMATGWILLEPTRGHPASLPLLGLTLWLMLRTRLSPLWPITAGALAGVLGWI